MWLQSTPMGSKSCCWFDSRVILQVVASRFVKFGTRLCYLRVGFQKLPVEFRAQILQIDILFFIVDLSLLQFWQECISKFCLTPFLSIPLLKRHGLLCSPFLDSPSSRWFLKVRLNVQYCAPLLHYVKDKGIDSALLFIFYSENILLKPCVCVYVLVLATSPAPCCRQSSYLLPGPGGAKKPEES